MTRVARHIRRCFGALCLVAVASQAWAQSPIIGPWDTLTVRVVEWRASTGETYVWEAFDGEFKVGADGRLALPLIGALEVAGRSTEEISADVAQKLQERVGLIEPPSAVVEIVAFRPFYVTGAVDTPGEYPFRPGLSVLQAVSIAGGLRRGPDITDRLERDAITARGQLRVYALQIDQLAAQRARLTAELEGAETIDFPPALVERRDDDPAVAQMLDEEQLIFDARRESFAQEVAANERLQTLLKEQIEALESQVALKESQVKSAQEELEGVRSLVERGLGTAARASDLERRVADYESGASEIVRSVIRAQVDISDAERNVIALRSTRQREIAVELRETQSTIEELVERYATAESMVEEAEVIAPAIVDANRRRETVEPSYSVVRVVDGRSQEIQADETTQLLPGDTVRVIRPLPQIPGVGMVRRPDGADSPALAARGTDRDER